MAKNITWKKSGSITCEIGFIEKEAVIEVQDDVAGRLAKVGFEITKAKPTHEKINNLWVKIEKKSEKEG